MRQAAEAATGERSMPAAETPAPVEPDVVRDPGRMMCLGVLSPWLQSAFMRYHPVFFVGCLAAFVLPRFVFRRPGTRVMIQWTGRRIWARSPRPSPSHSWLP